MKVLVTGALGFIGKNLCYELKHQQFEVLPIDQNDDENSLIESLKQADFIIHLAGINRPLSKEEFYQGNANFTFKLCSLMEELNKKIPIIFSSTIQATQNNDYGISKRQAEEYLKGFAIKNDIPVYIYRLSNVFGKWCRPNYNSAIATFCNNIARGLEICVNEQNPLLQLVYIDDIVKEFIDVIKGYIKKDLNLDYLEVQPIYSIHLKDIVALIYKFKSSRQSLIIPDMSGGFETKLYATYLSYLDPKDYIYELKTHSDNRGAFVEFIRTSCAGQVSVNVANPGITKGNHWHHTKNEKFLVVSGTGIIKLRKVDEEIVYDFCVSGDKLEVVDIPVGYTHSIVNLGQTPLITIIWASEPFNEAKPDTYFLEV